ncbi:MAG: hypothetical protein NZM11_13575, partial [Anaerolineales bacterium]|nr:hypothetical protein [Anaerolineales bacterium]
GVGVAEIAERSPFAAPVADLAGDDQPLLVELNRLARLAQGGVGVAEIAERSPFAAPVADLAADDQRLLVLLNRLARLAQVGVGQAEIAERCPSPRRSPISRLMTSACS